MLFTFRCVILQLFSVLSCFDVLLAPSVFKSWQQLIAGFSFDNLLSGHVVLMACPFILAYLELSTLIQLGCHCQVVIPRLPLDTLNRQVDLPTEQSYKTNSANDGTKFLQDFQVKAVRVAFLRKILWIVVLQLGIASGVAAATLFVDPVEVYLSFFGVFS